MLLDLRETVRNSKPLKYSLITLICIPFVLFGVGSYFSGGGPAAVAEVNGTEISQQQLDRAYQQQRQQLAQMFGGQLPEALANEEVLRQQALDQLVSQQVLESEVENQSFAVGDNTLARAIREMPVFQVDGVFDRQTYETQLRGSGMSVAAFEQSYRDDTALRQFQSGVINSSFTLPSEADLLSNLASQTRTIDAVEFDFDAARSAIEVVDEDVSAWFDDNKDNYQFPERVKIQYIELNSGEIASDIEVSDEEAESYYEDNRARYISAEQREASHILLNVEDAGDDDEVAEKRKVLDGVKERLAAGESFEDLAAEVSDDVGSAESGGSLGLITADSMVPEFENALNELAEVGDVSEVVTTEFGLHLIKLDGIEAESGKAFDEVKDEILQTVKNNKADSEFAELRELLTEASFDNPESLDIASEETGLTILESDWLDAEAELEPPLSNPAVLQTALSEEVLDDGINSDLINIGNRHLMVLRVLEHEDPRPQTLDDVRDEVTEALKGERAQSQLDEAVAAALAQLEDSGDVDTIAGESELATARKAEVIDRQSTLVDRNTVTEIFSQPRPAEGSAVSGSSTQGNGNRLVWNITSVDVPELDVASSDEESPGAQGQSAEAGANPRLGGVEFSALLESLRSEADVELTP